jgi:hypothetical protein
LIKSLEKRKSLYKTSKIAINKDYKDAYQHRNTTNKYYLMFEFCSKFMNVFGSSKVDNRHKRKSVKNTDNDYYKYTENLLQTVKKAVTKNVLMPIVTFKKFKCNHNVFRLTYIVIFYDAFIHKNDRFR